MIFPKFRIFLHFRISLRAMNLCLSFRSKRSKYAIKQLVSTLARTANPSLDAKCENLGSATDYTLRVQGGPIRSQIAFDGRKIFTQPIRRPQLIADCISIGLIALPFQEVWECGSNMPARTGEMLDENVNLHADRFLPPRKPSITRRPAMKRTFGPQISRVHCFDNKWCLSL